MCNTIQCKITFHRVLPTRGVSKHVVNEINSGSTGKSETVRGPLPLIQGRVNIGN